MQGVPVYLTELEIELLIRVLDICMPDIANHMKCKPTSEVFLYGDVLKRLTNIKKEMELTLESQRR